MKVRTSFVTNSSSSSFILMMDKIPADKYELDKMLFPDGTDPELPEGYGTIAMSGPIFYDMKQIDLQNPNDMNEILQIIRAHYWNAVHKIVKDANPDLSYQDRTTEEYYQKIDTEISKLQAITMDEIRDEPYIFTVTYCDYEGGDLLDYLKAGSWTKHIRCIEGGGH